MEMAIKEGKSLQSKLSPCHKKKGDKEGKREKRKLPSIESHNGEEEGRS